MRTHWVVVVAALAGAGCAGKLEDVVRLQASQDLACPARDVEVYDRRSDNYVRDFTVVGCGKTAHYQAACNMVESCVAYQPRTNVDAAASESLTAGVDAVTPAEPVEDKPGEWTVVETVRPKPPPAPEPVTIVEVSPGPGQRIAVELHNTCGETISLFLGDDPAGSGQHMTLGSTNMTTLQVPAGTKLWLVDGSGSGTAGVTLESSMRAVDATCSGLSAR